MIKAKMIEMKIAQNFGILKRSSLTTSLFNKMASIKEKHMGVSISLKLAKA